MNCFDDFNKTIFIIGFLFILYSVSKIRFLVIIRNLEVNTSQLVISLKLLLLNRIKMMFNYKEMSNLIFVTLKFPHNFFLNAESYFLSIINSDDLLIPTIFILIELSEKNRKFDAKIYFDFILFYLFT